MSLTPLLQEPLVVIFHALVAFAALFLGVAQLTGAKGTQRHRVFGWAWVVLMASVAISSFFIPAPFWDGEMSWIHALSALTLTSLVGGVWSIRAGNVRAHKLTMVQLFWFALVVTGLFTLVPGRVMHAVVFGS